MALNLDGVQLDALFVQDAVKEKPKVSIRMLPELLFPPGNAVDHALVVDDNVICGSWLRNLNGAYDGPKFSTRDRLQTRDEGTEGGVLGVVAVSDRRSRGSSAILFDNVVGLAAVGAKSGLRLDEPDEVLLDIRNTALIGYPLNVC